MTRKKKCAAAVIAVAGAVVLLAVLFWHRQPSVPYLIHEGDTAKVRKMEEDRKETLMVGASQIPSSIHPYQGQNETMDILKKLVYEPLAYRNQDGSLTYALAEKVVISQDGQEAEVTLKADRTFRDGSDVTAEAVAAAFGWHQEMANESAYQVVLQKVAKAEPVEEGILRIQFTGNSIDNLKVLEVPVMHVTEELLKKNETLAGSGPYEIDTLVPSKSVRLSLRDGMTAEDFPYKNVQIETPGGKDFTGILKAQAYDWMSVSDSQEEAACGDGAYDIYEFGKAYGMYLVCNRNHPEMADLQKRQLVMQSIDREKLFEDCFSQGLLPKGILLDRSPKEKKGQKAADASWKSLTLYRGQDNAAMAVADWLIKAWEQQGITVEQQDKIKEGPLTGQDVSMYLYCGWYEELLAEEGPFVPGEEMELSRYCEAFEDWIEEEAWILPLWQEGAYSAALAGRNTKGLSR
ncbi:MAG: ABC transporter substrate-binding protein [Blautia sp.]